MDIITLDDLYMLSSSGDIKINLKIAQGGMAMKALEDGKITTLKREEIQEIELFRGTRKMNMRVSTKSNLFNINNISENLIEKLKDAISKWYNINVYLKELEIQKVVTGNVLLTGDLLEFRSDKTIFDIPLKEIESVHEIKNEVSIAFNEGECGVSEMRFVCDKKIAEDIKERTKTGRSKEIVNFESLQSVLPRGKNDYIFYDNYLKIVGNTYEHKILFGNIKCVFFLEKTSVIREGDKEYYIVINVNPPIRQGQTRYQYIVMTFEEQLEEDIELNLDEEEMSKFPDLKKEYSGEVVFSFLSILKTLTGCKVWTTGDFTTEGGAKCLRCSSKAFEGVLYPLKRCLLFLPKAICMYHTDISLVEFSRINLSAMTAKTFDMKIITAENQFTFNGISKEDFGPLERYFSEYDIPVRSEIIADEGYAEEEDEDDESTNILETSESEPEEEDVEEEDNE